MKKIAIIAEYNPFHSGHKYHISQSRVTLWQRYQEDTAVIVIMSGHWVQQANCAIMDKWSRATMALEGGADLVIELPTHFATASAQGFARGAVSLLQGTGIVDYLSFGSEAGTLEGLSTIQQTLETEEYRQLLKAQLATGASFPRARQKAVEHMLGETSLLLSSPNNILALEYLTALSHYDSNIQALTIERKGSGFHSISQGERPLHTSATDLRSKLYGGNFSNCQPYLSATAMTVLQQQKFPSLQYCETVLLAKLATMTAEDWAKLPDSAVEEGLHNHLYHCATKAQSTEEFLQLAKNKRYPHARLRRLLLYALLGITKENLPQSPEYLRILAMNQKGRAVLQEMKSTATLPVLTKTANIHKSSPQCLSSFQKEVVFTDLYRLCFSEIMPKAMEWTHSPIIAPC